MARIGINPARGKASSYHPARVTVAVLTYIPDESGYFEQRLQILKISLASLLAHTTQPYDLMVFDNASCAPAVEYLLELQKDGAINYLILSKNNIGKIGALKIMFHAAPGEFIAYSDDDVFYYPGWLEAHQEIYTAFPQVGMVSGLPIRNAARHAHMTLDKIAANLPHGLQISYRRLIPDEWEADWALSTGRDPDAHLQDSENELDTVLTLEKTAAIEKGISKSCEAISSANHFQFFACKDVLLQALPDQWSGKLMGEMVELDEAVDRLGFLRLSTTQRYTRHIGNAISPAIREEISSIGLERATIGEPIKGTSNKLQSIATSQPRKQKSIMKLPGSRRMIKWVYSRLFDILYR